ncbi:MAG: substrate-binding domain-containing protein [Planctomycetota bacterium]
MADELRERIRAGEWPPGKTLPSLRRLASDFGVSDYTVRLALDELKREEILRVNARRRTVVARVPGSRRRSADGPVLVVISERLDRVIDGTHAAQLLRGILEGVQELDAAMLLVHGTRFRRQVPLDALDYPVRGIVLQGRFRDEVLERYGKLGLPVVMADRPPGEWELHAACVDNVRAAHDATTRLIRMGHRRLAFVRFVQLSLADIDPDSREREEGFRTAVEAAGLPEEAGPVFTAFSERATRRPFTLDLLAAEPRITAVLSADPKRAATLAAAAEERGLSVPGDLSIAAFQPRSGEPAHFAGPVADFEEIGRQAVLLLRQPKSPPKTARVSGIWTNGRTVGPPNR